jgi:hypothetical protein
MVFTACGDNIRPAEQPDARPTTDEAKIVRINPCNHPVDLGGVRLVYQALVGNTDAVLVNLSGTLPAGGYRAYTGTGWTGGGTVDGMFTTDLPFLGGGVGLRVTSTGTIMDGVGWGVAINELVEGLIRLRPHYAAIAGLPTMFVRWARPRARRAPPHVHSKTSMALNRPRLTGKAVVTPVAGSIVTNVPSRLEA